MIIQVQAISRILAGKDYSFVEDNLFSAEDFIGYDEEFKFITEHYKKYGNVPDEATFLSRFPEFILEEVTESDEYLVDALRENRLYLDYAKVIQHAADLLKVNSNDAVEYMRKAMADIQPSYSISYTDIAHSGAERGKRSEEVNDNARDWYIPTGFDEIDSDIYGFQRGNELVCFYARTNMGKTWVAQAIATFMAEAGFIVGFFEPEMSDMDVGYRFDTLHGHMSNNSIRLGRFNDEFSLDDYKDYLDTLDNITGKLLVAHPKSFAKKTTVTKLRQWIKQTGMQILFIDGITYLTDERYKRGDSKTISLTNISEDLMELTAEMKIPIVVVVQANRGGVVDKHSTDTPELENIRDSDGIAQNSSIVFALRQVKDKDGDIYLIIENKKNRSGIVGKSYKYKWDIDKGVFEPVSDIDVGDDSDTPHETKEVTGASTKRGKRNVEDDF